MTLNDLINEHICIAFDKQVAIAEFLGNEYFWELNIKKGIITFSNTKGKIKNQKFNIQVVGTESELDNSWLWAWANPEMQVYPRLIEVSNAMYNIGIENNIREIIDAEVSLTKFPNAGHIFCLIASSEFKASGYFRATHESGAVYVLIEGMALKSNMDSQKLISNFQKVREYFDFDHKLALEVYLPHHGYKVEKKSEEKWFASKNSQQTIQISFNTNNKVEDIKLI